MVRISDMWKCITTGLKTKLVLTITILSLFFIYDGGGASPQSGLLPHFTYIFMHANIWHMITNLFVLWSVRQKMNVWMGYLIAVGASWLPMWTDKPTVGMSGMLFAMFGVMWGERGDWKGFIKAGMPVILVMMVIPGINGLIHLYCYVIGFVFLFIRRRINRILRFKG